MNPKTCAIVIFIYMPLKVFIIKTLSVNIFLKNIYLAVYCHFIGLIRTKPLD